MEKPYLLQPAPQSYCPRCLQPVELLCNEAMTGPSFYICFPCRFIGQVGVGPVHKE
jgi:hypothetical protein